MFCRSLSDGATTEGTVLAAAPKASIPRRSLQPFPRFPGFRGVLGGPKKANLESVEKWSSWSPKTGPGKMKLWSPKTGPRTGLEKSILNTLEIVESVEKWSSWSPKTSSRNGAVKPQHGKAGQARGLVRFGVQKFRFSTLSTISRVFKIDFGTRFLGPVFGVQELHFSTLSTLSMLFGVYFWTLLLEPGFGVQELIFPRFPGWLFGPSPLETLESMEMVGKEAGVRAPMVFFCGLVVDATTRSDTTCSRRWSQTTDLSALRGGRLL